MNIFEYAMQMEKDGEAYYRELAAKTPHKGIQHIFEMLADAEVIHYNIFRGMKNREQVTLPDSASLTGVKNIFTRLKEEGQQGVDASQADLYRKAQDIEVKSRDFYLEKSGESTDDREKAILKKIAGEEQKHYLILENIIDFVSGPSTWIEDPEWYHLEEY
jgi:rubrerythrin